MRKKFIAGNWKMNLSRSAAVELAAGIAKASAQFKHVDIAVCPPACYLEAVKQALAGSSVLLGAQTCHHEAKGAFTGEMSVPMLLDVGCTHVILGHSERRHIFKETNADVNKKVHAALGQNLLPIVCVGETLEERKAGKTSTVVRDQMHGSLLGVTAEQLQKVVIAYEPVWAIGTGLTATPEQAEEVHADLRKWIASHYNAGVAAVVRIQYGGSVDAEKAPALLAQPNIDGALVGGASLKVDSFTGILVAAK